MNIAFLFLHPFAGSLGSTVRVLELTSNLSKYGIISHIITPYETNQTITENVNVVSVAGTLHKLGLAQYLYRATKFAYYNPFFVKYFLSNAKFQNEIAKHNAPPIIKALKQKRIQILQVEQDFAIPTAIEVKKNISLPLVVDLHNITSEELVASGTIKKGGEEYKRLQDTLRRNLSEADAIIVVSNLMKEYVISKYGISPDRVYVVAPAGKPIALMKNTSIQKRVVFSGMVSYREHVDLFVKSMPLVQEKIKNVKFFITAKGEDLKKIKKLAEKLNVTPTFFWYPKKDDFINFLYSCDVAVLPSSNDLARQMGTPIKLFDYLSAGLPVVVNDIGGWTRLIKEEKVGLVVADDPSSFGLAIVRLLDDSKILKDYKQRCLMLVKKKYNWDNSIKILIQCYQDTVDKKKI